jgi:antitoxin ParD1/3/4
MKTLAFLLTNAPEPEFVSKVDTRFSAQAHRLMTIRKTRNVSLTPELEAFLDSRVASGRYRSASEVVRAALRLLESQERQQRRGREKPHLGGHDAR